MKTNFLYLLIATSILSCQSEQKEKAEESTSPVHLAHDPEENDKPQSENAAIETTCSDEYEHVTFSLGKGLVMANSARGYNDPLVNLYNDSLLQDKYVSWHLYNEDKPAKVICPKYLHREPDILHFVYLKETSKAYQVINGFDEIKYLPKGKENVSISWQDYILSSFGIRRSTIEESETPNQPIKKSPSENSEIITFPKGYEMLCPMEINGDWVKVQHDCFYNNKSNKFEGQPCHDFIDKCKPAQFGWIKWREKNEILVDIFLTP